MTSEAAGSTPVAGASYMEGLAMSVIKARVVSLHWEENANASQEATLEVEHENGDRQMFVLPILRMTNRIKSERRPGPSPRDTLNRS